MPNGDESLNNDKILKHSHQACVAKLKLCYKTFNKVQPPYSEDIINDYSGYVSCAKKDILSFSNQFYKYLKSTDCKYNIIQEINSTFQYECDIFLESNRDIHESYFNFRNFRSKLKEDPDDGTLSPSNPFYTNFDPSKEEFKESDILMDKIMYSIKEHNDLFCTEFRKIRRKIVRLVQKEKQLFKQRKFEKKRNKKLQKKDCVNPPKIIENEDFDLDAPNDDPQSIMQHFFSRYLTSGQWSWTEWNSYMRKIRESRPDWFAVFASNSAQIGLNWQSMFRCDLEAVELSNVRVDLDSESVDQCGLVVQNDMTDVISKEGKSVLFTQQISEIVELNIESQSRDELFCDACQKHFRNQRSWHVHLRGVMHTQNELRQLIKSDPDKVNEIVSEKPLTKKVELQSTVKSEVPKPDEQSQTTKIEHINQSRTNAPKLVSFSRVARIQGLLNQCTEPLIGLEHMTEYQMIDAAIDCKYVCYLCRQKLTKTTLLRHLTSSTHRKGYLKRSWPGLAQLLKQDQSTGRVQKRRLEVYATAVEEHCGRCRPNLMGQRCVINASAGMVKQLNDSGDKEVEDGEIDSDIEDVTDPALMVPVIQQEKTEEHDKKAAEELEAGEISSTDGYASDRDFNSGGGSNSDNEEQQSFDESEFQNFDSIWCNTTTRPTLTTLSCGKMLEQAVRVRRYVKVQETRRFDKISSEALDQFDEDVATVLNVNRTSQKKLTQQSVLEVKQKKKDEKVRDTMVPEPKMKPSPPTAKISDKLARHCDFLGINVNRPPPPLRSTVSSVATTNNVMLLPSSFSYPPPVSSPRTGLGFISPGMIEHAHSSFGPYRHPVPPPPRFMLSTRYPASGSAFQMRLRFSRHPTRPS